MGSDVGQKQGLGSRVSELQALDLRYRSYLLEGVVFHIPTLGKKRVVDAPPYHFLQLPEHIYIPCS